VFMEKHPEQAKGFMIAYVKGLRDYNDAFEKNQGKAEIIKILTMHTKIKDPAIFEKVVPVGLNPDGMINILSLKQDAQWYLDKGYVKDLPDIDKIVDLSYAKNAVKVLGPYK